MNSTAKTKMGRPRKPHVTSWGESVNGLRRRPHDGRWVIVETGEMFSQPDERLAVMHFHHWQSNREGKHHNFAVPVANPETAKMLRSFGNPAKGHVIVIEQFPTVHRIDPAHEDPVTILKRIPEPLLWEWMKKQLIDRPKYAAKQTGIEWLAYGPSVPKPTPSPSLKAVGDLYLDKAKITDKWRSKSRLIWDEFQDSIEAQTLREVSQEQVAAYKSDVLDSAQSVTFTKHRFGQVKTILNYSKQWGLWAEDRTKALAFCSILIPPTATSLDPSPIMREDFHKLLNAATDQTKAILLLALNCCMYGSEVADLKWTDLNIMEQTLVSDRGKTGVARVAVLWQRTIDAIEQLPRIDGMDTIFATPATKQPHNANTIGKAFRKLRTTAKVDAKVKFNHIRDGAYTAAAECPHVQFEHARILGGHRAGMADHYLKRRPKIVADACLAIEREYFG